MLPAAEGTGTPFPWSPRATSSSRRRRDPDVLKFKLHFRFCLSTTKTAAKFGMTKRTRHRKYWPRSYKLCRPPSHNFRWRRCPRRRRTRRWPQLQDRICSRTTFRFRPNRATFAKLSSYPVSRLWSISSNAILTISPCRCRRCLQWRLSRLWRLRQQQSRDPRWPRPRPRSRRTLMAPTRTLGCTLTGSWTLFPRGRWLLPSLPVGRSLRDLLRGSSKLTLKTTPKVSNQWKWVIGSNFNLFFSFSSNQTSKTSQTEVPTCETKANEVASGRSWPRSDLSRFTVLQHSWNTCEFQPGTHHLPSDPQESHAPTSKNHSHSTNAIETANTGGPAAAPLSRIPQPIPSYHFANNANDVYSSQSVFPRYEPRQHIAAHGVAAGQQHPWRWRRQPEQKGQWHQPRKPEHVQLRDRYGHDGAPAVATQDPEARAIVDNHERRVYRRPVGSFQTADWFDHHHGNSQAKNTTVSHVQLCHWKSLES